MATTRNIRQFGSLLQNQLENVGLGADGDAIGAARASFALRPSTEPATNILANDPAASAGTGGPVNIVNGDPTQLATGRAAIISYETDTSAGGSPDAVRIVLLEDLAAGGVIYLTDRSWNGSSFVTAAGDGTYTYTAPGGGATAGTVITLSASQLSSAGITLSNTGETLYLYQGSDANTPTRFLFAADIADGNTTFNGNLTGTGLTAGVNAVAVAVDNASYSGSATQIPQTQLADIATNTRWHGSDTDDAAGTTTYSEVSDTTITNAFNNPDMVIIAGMAGGGQSDAVLRIGNDSADGNGVNFARLFRDNPAFNHITDVTFDLEDGYFFFVDSDGNSINRIMRGNVADLVSGISNPTFTQVFATDNFDNGVDMGVTGELITGIEIDKASNKIYWWDGDLAADFEGGWQLYKANYDGTGVTLVTTLDSENAGGNPFGASGGMGDWALDLNHGTAGYAYAVNSTGSVDGFGNVTLFENHIVRVDLSTGVITVLALGGPDTRSDTGPGGIYHDGRLINAEGQIIALDVDSVTGIVYFITQPVSSTDHGGIFSYNPATDTLTELWEQPTNAAYNTLQAFPTANMTHIEVDEIGGRLYVSATSDTDTENDGTPGTNESDAAIFSMPLDGSTAPTLLTRVYEPTANGAPTGMEIDYAPVIVAVGAGSTYTETAGVNSAAGGSVATTFSITVNDADTTLLQSATIAITGGFVPGDVLTFSNGGGITGSYNAATGVLTYTGLASAAAYQALLPSIGFTNAGDNPTNYGHNTSRTISFTAFDGLANSDPATITVNVNGINDAPVNTVSSPQAASEDTGQVITGLSISDPDADPANQTMTVTLSVNHGTITIFTNAGGGVTAGQVTGNGTATVTITATQNQINATFGHATGVTYLNTLDFNGSDTLTILTSDNGNTPGGALTDSDPVTINIAAVNDAPTVVGDGTEDSLTILEDTPSAVGQTVNALFAGQYSDARDNQIPNGGASSPGAFSGIAVVGNASSAGTGNWQYFDTGSSTWVNIGARTTATALLISNTTALRFNPAADYNGAEPLLTVRLIDNSLGFGINFQTVDISGVNATGGTTAYSAGSVTLGGTITPVNDAPVNAPGGAIVTDEDSSNVPITGISVSDVDDTTLTVTLYVAHGSLTISTAVGGGITAGQITGGANGSNGITITATAAAINATLAAVNGLLYTPDPNFNGSDPLTISTYDGTFGSATSFATPLNSGALTNATSLVTGDLNGDGKLDLVYIGDVAQQVGVRLGNGDGTFGATTSLAAGTRPSEVILADVDGDNDLDIVSVDYATGAASNGSVGVLLNNGAGSFGAYQSLATLQSPFDVVAADVNGDGRLDLIAARRDYGLVSVLLATGAPGNFAAPVTYNATTPNLTTGITVGDFNNDGLLDIVAFNQQLKAGGGNGTVTLLLNTGNGTFGAPTDIFTSGTVQPFEGLAYDLNGDGNMDLVFANYTTTSGLNVMLGNGDGTFGAATFYAMAGQPVNVSVGDVNGDGRPDLITGIGAASSVGVFVGNGNGTFQARVDYGIASTFAETTAVGDFNGDGRPDIVVNGGTNTGQFVLLSTSDRLGDVDVKSITVNSVNDAPSGTDKAVTMLEDGTYTFSTADFGFSDGDGDSLAAVKFTTVPGAGTIFYDADGPGGNAPVAIGAGDSVPVSQLILGHVYYVPAANGNGAGYGNFTFQVQDDGGTLNGGVDLDQSPNSFTINVTAVNDAPTSTNLNGDAATWIEGSAPITLDVGGNATIADVDTSDFSGGTLTVHIGTGLVAGQDQLGIQSSGAVTVNGANLESGGLVFATFSGGGAGGGDLVITFTSSGTPATAALVQDLVRGITFTNSGGISPTAGLRTISWTLVDGDGIANSGTDTLSLTSTVDVQAINDAPTGQDATYVINEDATYSFTAASFGFNDVNNDAFAGVVITTIPVPGTLFYDADGPGGAAAVAVTNGQFISASEIALGHLYYTPVANGSGVPFSSFTFQVRDNGGTGNGGQDTDQSANTITFNVTAVNDAPTIAAVDSVLMAEDTTLTLSGAAAISVADVDATTLTVTLTVSHGTLTLSGVAGLSFGAGDGTGDVTMTFNGTAANINAALNGLHYDPTLNYSGPDAISINVSDEGQTGTGGVQTASDSIAIALYSVNDAPSGTDTTVVGSEDDPYVFAASDFGFTDPNDSPANSLLAVKITTVPGAGTLFLDSDGPGGAAPVAVSAGQFISLADINAGHLYFLGALDGYGSPYASFTFQVQDNGGTGSGGVDLDPSANVMTINLTPDNLAPVVDLNGAGGGINNTTSFIEDGSAVTIGTGATVADQDLIPNGGSLVSMTVTLTDRVAGDSLSFNTPVPGGFSVSTTSNAGSIQLVITGTGTGADYQAILNSIVYATTSQDPDVGGTDLQRTVTVVVNDGQADSAVATTTVNIVAVDDLPVAQPDAFTITESGTIVGGNLFADNGAGADTDPDGPPLSISAVNGSGANVGNQIVLGSGALLTVNANGTFSYDPNGVFLPTPTGGSGASNTPAHDGFSYTVAGGNTVSVVITLTGLDTDDLLLGTAGADVLIGGNGNDTYYVGNAADVVIETGGGGTDVVYTNVSYALAAGSSVETLSTTDTNGTAALSLTGNELGNIIYGNAGDNILNGGGGADYLKGYAGNDTYYVDTAGDVVDETAGGGTDVVYTSASYSLAAGSAVEILSTTDINGMAALALTGNELGNIIYGNAGDNVMIGGGGADYLKGYAGNDIYYVDNAGDVVDETAGGGTDVVYTNVSYALAAGSSVETLSTTDTNGTAALSLTGNELGNIIYGNAGDNVLNGGAGADYLKGYGGNDTYYVDNAGDAVIEDAGGGNDSVYASASYTLGAGQEIEFLAAANFSATTALNLTGNEFANTIYGNDGANVLDGKGGNDLLVGQGGADTFAFTTALGANNVDVVFGFEHGTDKIALDDAIFTAIGPLGALNVNAFVVGSAAGDASDRIIYNNLTGVLYYDVDGAGGAAAIQFATLSPGLTLTASDFVVI